MGSQSFWVALFLSLKNPLNTFHFQFSCNIKSFHYFFIIIIVQRNSVWFVLGNGLKLVFVYQNVGIRGSLLIFFKIIFIIVVTYFYTNKAQVSSRTPLFCCCCSVQMKNKHTVSCLKMLINFPNKPFTWFRPVQKPGLIQKQCDANPQFLGSCLNSRSICGAL